MRKNLNIARNLGYVEAPDSILVRPADLDEVPPGEQLILCTGSQGEPLSALTRIAYNDHPAVRVERGDTVIISARPVPGNELRVHDSINRLTRSGAEVLHEENAPVHVSGHARAEELRTLLGLVRPKAVMPIHGEFRMLAAHARLAQDAGVPAASIVIAENGDVVELSRDGVAHRRPRRGGRDLRRRARRRGHLRRRAPRPPPPLRGRRADRGDDALERHRRGAGADLARLRASPRSCSSEMRSEAHEIVREPARATTSARSSCSRSTSTTESDSSSTTARAGGR